MQTCKTKTLIVNEKWLFMGDYRSETKWFELYLHTVSGNQLNSSIILTQMCNCNFYVVCSLGIAVAQMNLTIIFTLFLTKCVSTTQTRWFLIFSLYIVSIPLHILYY